MFESFKKKVREGQKECQCVCTSGIKSVFLPHIP